MDYDYSHAAVLCAQLPKTGRVWTAIDPDNAWDDKTVLLREIEHGIRVLAWQKTKAAQQKRDFPEPIPEPSQRDRGKRDADALRYRAFVDSVLGVNENG